MLLFTSSQAPLHLLLPSLTHVLCFSQAPFHLTSELNLKTHGLCFSLSLYHPLTRNPLQFVSKPTFRSHTKFHFLFWVNVLSREKGVKPRIFFFFFFHFFPLNFQNPFEIWYLFFIMSSKSLKGTNFCTFASLGILALSLVHWGQLVQCQDVGDNDQIDNPAVLPFITQILYGRISNVTAVLSRQISNRSSFCVKDP